MLITFEGIDYSGKSTVINSIEPDFDFIKTKEPFEDESVVGDATREVINKGEGGGFNEVCTLFMFLADHAYHVENFIKPELSSNNIVVSDRYIDSRYAYQQESLQGLIDKDDTLNWIQSIQESGKWTVEPDLTILLDIPVQEFRKRSKKDKTDSFEKERFLSKVRSNYLDLSDELDRYRVVDANKDEKVVVQNVERIINSYYYKNY